MDRYYSSLWYTGYPHLVDSRRLCDHDVLSLPYLLLAGRGRPVQIFVFSIRTHRVQWVRGCLVGAFHAFT